MTKLTKSLLVLSAANLVAGVVFTTNLIDVHNASVLYITLPTGAVFFGLFLISRLLEKEVLAYDAEQRRIHSAAATPSKKETSNPEPANRQPLTKPKSA